MGASLWPANAESFDAAGESRFAYPVPSPRGLAFAPGGKLLFAACYGIYDGEGNKVMIVDHAKAKAAINNDAGDGAYNLAGSSPESLDDMNGVSGYEDTVRYATGFDGPRNVAFQEFPVIQADPPVVHLATGGVAESEGMVWAGIHPIYGDTVKVGLADGSSAEFESLSLQGQGLAWHRQDLGVNRDIFEIAPVAAIPPQWEFAATRAGVGKAIADVAGHPSNPVFVTVPPQKFIQVLFGEACRDTTEMTYISLASVVKNRIRLTRQRFRGQEGGGDCPLPGWSYTFGFPPEEGAQQLRADNTNELEATEQLEAAFDSGYPSVGNPRYEMAETLEGFTNDQDIADYESCANIAGDALLDLTRTISNDSGAWRIPSPDPNYMDLLQDPTAGAFSFYSPTNLQWGDSTDALSIAGTLHSGSTTFPTSGEFESDIVCSRMFPTFCGTSNRATYIQVVVVRGVANNYDACGGAAKNNAPQFIFFKIREQDEPAVVYGN